MSTEFVISFDTTGSMYPCLTSVRQRVSELITRIFREMPDALINISAHGDYCDKDNPYVMVSTGFKGYGASNILLDFVQKVKSTNGGDGPECYEYVMNEVGKMDWRSDNKVFIIFADAVPHKQNEYQNFLHLDWQEEAKKLGDNGVRIFAIQCLHYGREADAFYQKIADLTGGKHLNLHQFENAVEAVLAVVYQNMGQLEQYQTELETEFKMNRGLANLFLQLGSERTVEDKYTKVVDGLVPVSPTRFQVLTVPSTTDIKSFVESSGARFRKGKGFYQFTKSELVQERKEVVLRDKVTGDMFTGSEARNMIGLPYGERGNLRPKFLTDYEVFIQSTSSNRKLIGNTKFLYEVI